MDRALDWLESHLSDVQRDLAELVAIPSVSTDGRHQDEVQTASELVARKMTEAGLRNVQTLSVDGSNPYVYGDWLDAPGQPTVLFYAHYDVQPATPENWKSPPFALEARDGLLYGRGSVDDKGGCLAQLAALAAWIQGEGRLPVNVKVLFEGEEEIGSKNLLHFFKRHRELLQCSVIVVTDTENIRDGTPSITYSLRGLVSAQVEVQSAEGPKHSGYVGGAMADAAIALSRILARLYWENGEVPIPGFYDAVRPTTEAERATFAGLTPDEAALRGQLGVLPGVALALEPGRSFYEQTSRRPAVTVIAQEASSMAGASNQVLARARAIVSCRIVPDQDPQVIGGLLRDFLSQDPPWGVKVDVSVREEPAPWWITSPQGPAFTAALQALEAGYGTPVVPLGCGGTIGFVRPVVDLLGGPPALLLGISGDNLHAPNEYLHQADWHKLMRSLVHLLGRLARLPGGKTS